MRAWWVVPLCALALAGCGGDGGDGGTEAGTDVKRWSKDGVSVEYPGTWSPVDSIGVEAEGLEFAADGPVNEAGGRPRLAIFRNKREHATIKAFARSIQVGRPFELPGANAADFEPAEIPGAEAGWRLSTTFDVKEKDGSTVPGELVELLAMTSDEEFSISVAATQRAFETPEIKGILSSFRVG